MKKYLLIFFSLFVAIANIIPQQTQTRKLESFNKIEAYGSIDLELKKGASELLEMASATVDLDNVKTKVDGSLLVISTNDQLFNKDKQIKLTLIYRELLEVKGNGGAQITVLDTLSGNKLVVSEGSGSSFSATVKFNKIEAEAGEGGVISLEGNVRNQIIVTATRGVYDAFGLVADSSFIRSNTGGRCKVNTKLFIDAAASTGGFVGYKGEPKVTKFKSTLGGEIIKAEETEE